MWIRLGLVVMGTILLRVRYLMITKVDHLEIIHIMIVCLKVNCRQLAPPHSMPNQTRDTPLGANRIVPCAEKNASKLLVSSNPIVSKPP